MLSSFSGMKVFSSPYAYKTVMRVTGTPDKRKPNNRRPLFKRRAVRIPLAYLVKGMGVVAAPEIVERVRNFMVEETTKTLREETAKAFGLPPSILTTESVPLTLQTLYDAMNKILSIK